MDRAEIQYLPSSTLFTIDTHYSNNHPLTRPLTLLTRYTLLARCTSLPLREQTYGQFLTMAAKRSFDQAGLGDEENRAVKRQSSEEQLQSPDDIFGNAGLDDADAQDLYGDHAYLVDAMESTNRAQAGVFEEAELQQNLDPTYLPVILESITTDMMPTTSASMADNVSGLFEEPLSASEGVAGGNGDQTSLDGGVSASQVTSANGGPAESNNAPTEDPVTAAATDVQVPQEEAQAPPKKRKGRPPGSRNATTRASKKNKNKEGSSDNAGDDKDDKRDASLEMRQTYAMKIPAKPLKPGEPDDTDAELSEFDDESDEESRTGKRTKRRRKSKRGKIKESRKRDNGN